MIKGVLSIIAVAALVATAGLSGVATSGSSDEKGHGFFHHFHRFGHHLHGGGEHHQGMARLLDELELTPEQHRRLERVHEIMGSPAIHDPAGMVELHDRLVAGVERGRVDGDDVKQIVDTHVELLRERGYAVADELVALVNELDPGQREKLAAHLRQVHEAGDGHGHGH